MTFITLTFNSYADKEESTVIEIEHAGGGGGGGLLNQIILMVFK